MKIYSLKENHLFSKAYKNGKKAGGKYVCVYLLPDYHAARLQRANPQKSRINRIGLTAAKKLGGAVVRNRTKRMMREAYYRLLKTYEIQTGKIIVIAARSAAVNVRTPDIYNELEEAFFTLGLIRAKLSDDRQ